MTYFLGFPELSFAVSVLTLLMNIPLSVFFFSFFYFCYCLTLTLYFFLSTFLSFYFLFALWIQTRRIAGAGETNGSGSKTDGFSIEEWV